MQKDRKKKNKLERIPVILHGPRENEFGNNEHVNEMKRNEEIELNSRVMKQKTYMKQRVKQTRSHSFNSIFEVL